MQSQYELFLFANWLAKAVRANWSRGIAKPQAEWGRLNRGNIQREPEEQENQSRS